MFRRTGVIAMLAVVAAGCLVTGLLGVMGILG